MFPAADDRPPLSAQSDSLAAISGLHVLDFFDPPCAIHGWRPEVFAAPVPKTAVHEDTDPLTGENEVCLALKSRLWPPIDAKAQSNSV